MTEKTYRQIEAMFEIYPVSDLEMRKDIKEMDEMEPYDVWKENLLRGDTAND